MAEIKANDQVTRRMILRNNTTLIETGTVVSVDGKRALVSFNGPSGSRKVVSVDQLEPVKARFGGRAKVHPDPLKRFGH